MEHIGATKHRWEETRLLILCRLSQKNRIKLRTIPFNFVEHGFTNDGFWAQCFNAAPAPIHLGDVYSVLAAITAIAAAHPDFLTILNTRPALLMPSDIAIALGYVDTHYRAKKIASGAAVAEKVRKYLKLCRAPLANGTLANQAPYKTTYPVPPRKPRADIGAHDASVKTDYSIPPDEAINAENEAAFLKIAQKHYDNTIRPILNTCVRILDEHKIIADILHNASKASMPTSLQARTIRLFEEKGEIDGKVLKRRTPDERLILAIAIADKNSLHISSQPKHNLLLLDGISCLDTLSGGKSMRYRFGVLLSRHYLSRHVVTACFVIILIATRWNPETLSAVSADRVKRTAHGYEISGLKRKTKSNQNTEIIVDDSSIHIEETSAARAFELLLWHDRNVTKFAKRKTNSIFVSQNLTYAGGLEFDLFNSAVDFSNFTKTWGLASFNPSELRHSVERHHYLKEGMVIEKSRTVLGHRDSLMSEYYVGGEISSIINEAHLTRFMGFLAHAIYFQTGRKEIPSHLSETNQKTIKSLLTPPGEFSPHTDNVLIDALLDDPSKFHLVIGLAEAEQCARQRHYYIKNIFRLSSMYPDRFRRYDLPRIFVCLALYNIIKSSELKSTIEKVEAEINAK